MIRSKKGIELAISTVVTLIIGIILFGLGMALFGNFLDEGEDSVNDMRNQVRAGLTKLECNTDEWLCAPTLKTKLGEKATGYVYVVNRDESNYYYSVDISSSSVSATTDSDGYLLLEKAGCGTLRLLQFPESLNIQSGSNVGFPFSIHTSQVTKSCSFTFLATLTNQGDGSGEVGLGTGETTPVIIRVD